MEGGRAAGQKGMRGPIGPEPRCDVRFINRTSQHCMGRDAPADGKILIRVYLFIKRRKVPALVGVVGERARGAKVKRTLATDGSVRLSRHRARSAWRVWRCASASSDP